MGWANFRGDNKNETTQNTTNNNDNSVRVADGGGVNVADAATFFQSNTTTDAGLVKSATEAFMESANTVQKTIAANNTAVNASLAIADGMTDNSAPIYLGSSAVTAATAAIKLNPGDTYIDETMAAAAWYAISSSAAQSLNVMRGN